MRYVSWGMGHGVGAIGIGHEINVVGHGSRGMDHGAWVIGYASWGMDLGAWIMRNDAWGVCHVGMFHWVWIMWYGS